MAVTHYYVDPSIAGDSGTGTIGDPYGDLQHCMNTGTRSGSTPTQINIKAGTDEILAATLDWSTWGSPGVTSPTIFRGYTSAANDGGQGGIDGNAGNFSITPAKSYVAFADLKMHNTGSANILPIGFCQTVFRCEFTNSTGNGIHSGSNTGNKVFDNHLHDISGVGIYVGAAQQCVVTGNYLKNGTKDFSIGIEALGRGATVTRNILSLDGSSNGIEFGYGVAVTHNSVLAASGSGSGILADTNAISCVLNNLVEGFTSGEGFDWDASEVSLFLHNGAYNNGTNYPTVDEVLNPVDNEALGASPFDKSGSDTFANRFTYFAPVDTGNVRGGAYPDGCRLDKGAVQHADPAGGGVSLPNTRRSILIGR